MRTQSADAFATSVVLELVKKYHYPRASAEGAVHREEGLIRGLHASGASPSFAAKRVALKAPAPRHLAPVQRRQGHAGGRGRATEGLNIEALLPSARGNAVSLPVIQPVALVCTSETWQPALFIPADEYGDDPNIIEPNIEPIDDDGEDGDAVGDVLVEEVTPPLTGSWAETAASKKGLRQSSGTISSLLNIAKGVKKNPAAGEAAIAQLAKILSKKSPDGGRIVVPTKKGKVSTGASWLSGGAYMIERSANKKLSMQLSEVQRRVGLKMESRPRRGTGHRTATTYTSISGSCPTSCALMGSGGGRFVASDTSCYALLHQNIGPLITILNGVVDALHLSPVQVAQDEANVIDASYRRPGAFDRTAIDFRIHTAGDSKTREGTRLIAAAIARWQQRGGGQAWGYTHAWAETSRKDWGNISTLASVQNAKEANDAAAAGWMPTIVVKPHTFKRLADMRQKSRQEEDFRKKVERPAVAFKLQGSDITWIPCPAQNPEKSLQIACVNCRLCMNDHKHIGRKVGIAFEAHGSGSRRAITYEDGYQLVKTMNNRTGREQTHLPVLQKLGKAPKKTAEEEDDTPIGFV
jgi:RNAse (barnase) inhibitor barstar